MLPALKSTDSLMSDDLEQRMRDNCLARCPNCNGSGFVRDQIAFGKQMQERRTAHNLTLRELAAQMGLRVNYLSDLEHGRRRWRSGLIAAHWDAISMLRPNLENDLAMAALSSPA